MKGRLNLIVDALMFLLMAAVAGLGFLMKYVLVPGKERPKQVRCPDRGAYQGPQDKVAESGL